MKWPLFHLLVSDVVVEEVTIMDFTKGKVCPGPMRACMVTREMKRATGLPPGELPPSSPWLDRQALASSMHSMRCDACGRPAEASWAMSSSMGHFWMRADAPEELKRHPRDFGIGAAWQSPWLECLAHGEHSQWGWDDWPFGHAPWEILTPGGGWNPESRARNCTMPQDRGHRCWVLDYDAQGLPYAAHKRGNTCGAGAGSIQCGDWHGWLEGGCLKDNLGE